MKRIIALLICISLVLCFSGCGKKDRFKDEEVLFDLETLNNASETENVQSESVDGVSDESSSDSSAESSADGSADTSADTSADSSSANADSQGSSSSESGDGDIGSVTEQNDGSSVEDNEKEKVTGIELIQADGIYFPEIDDLYIPAAKIYYELTSGNLPVDWDLGRYEFTVDGSTNTYWRISDSRFDSVAELEAYLNAYFTEDFIETFYNPSLFYDYNGHLYAVTGVSGDNILFAGCEFKLTKQTTMRVMFDCVSYFFKSPEEIPEEHTVFNEAPEDASMFNSSTVSFTLEVDESGHNWRFSQFGNIK